MLAESFGYAVMFLASAAAGLLAAFCATATHDPGGERREPNAQVSLNMGWRGIFSTSAVFPSVLLCCFTVTYGAVGVFLPLVFEARHTGNPGLFFSVYAVALLVARGPLGKVSDRWGRGIVIAPGLVGMTIALFVLSSASSLIVMLAVAVLYGISVAAMQPALQAMVVDRAKPHERNAAMGTFTMAWDLGTGIGCYMWGVVAQAVGFELMYLYASAFGIFGLVILVAGGGLRRKASIESSPQEKG
jgi:MFS family permease